MARSKEMSRKGVDEERPKQTARRSAGPLPPLSKLGVQKGAASQRKKQDAKSAKKAGKVSKDGHLGQYELRVSEDSKDSYNNDEDEETHSMSVFQKAGATYATFSTDILGGCMKFGKRKVSKGQTTFDFKWRGREMGEGQIQFGSENKGTLKFEDDKVKGTLESDYGNFLLEGEKIADTPSDASTSLWEYCTAEQHEIERVNRWK